ncbi:hypothetical protein XELAEV_18009998mg [Xenopus laevis]|uniref:Uncharacterized protein n=1 Tax=Xenopus laevis TaxID=8355 RepID=A0A974DTB7_XENLA|nr:hypothetical protein XELAEV_18009998mg [Xenopus laevis]
MYCQSYSIHFFSPLVDGLILWRVGQHMTLKMAINKKLKPYKSKVRRGSSRHFSYHGNRCLVDLTISMGDCHCYLFDIMIAVTF